MKYSSALVLGALAAGAAAHNGRHASFHARRNADNEVKRADYANVDYSKVDWSKIPWEEVFSKTKPSPTPKVIVAEVAHKEEVKPTVTPTPTPSEVYSAPVEASSTKEQKPKETKIKEKIKETFDKIGDFLEDLVDGVEDFCKEKGISGAGKNDKSPNGGIWLGQSDWSANFHNAGDDKVWLACWQDKGFTGMTLNVNRPEILIRIPVGENQTVSFAPGAASACAPMYPDTILGDFGGVYNAWFEITTGPNGAFDVSKNTRMDGNSIDAVGSKCTSNMDTCCFECQDKNAKTCTTGYTLVNCQAANGGGGGYDPIMQGVGGGCSMGDSSEKITVTLSN